MGLSFSNDYRLNVWNDYLLTSFLFPVVNDETLWMFTPLVYDQAKVSNTANIFFASIIDENWYKYIFRTRTFWFSETAPKRVADCLFMNYTDCCLCSLYTKVMLTVYFTPCQHSRRHRQVQLWKETKFVTI